MLGPASPGNPWGVAAPSDPSQDLPPAIPPNPPDDGDPNVPIEQLSSEPPPIVERPPVHLGRVVDPDVEDEPDEPVQREPVTHSASMAMGEHPIQPDAKHMGRVVDPDVADDMPIEQLSTEPPPAASRRRRSSIPDDPTLRPHTAEPMPSSEDLLDPGNSPPPIPRHQPRIATPSVLSPKMTAVFGALFGLAGIIAVFAILHRVSPQSANAKPAAPPTETASAAPPLTATRALAGLADFEDEGPAVPGPWRVSSMKDEPGMRIISGTVGLEPFVNTLQSKGLSKRETYRILAAFKAFDVLKRPSKSAEFVVAFDTAKGKVRGFELKVSSLDVYQAKENEEGLLVASKLDMKVSTRDRSTAVRITGSDFEADLKRAKLRPSVAAVVDAAFDGRASVSSMPKNSTLRVILKEKTALGRFAEYEHVIALEYVSSKPDTKPLRLYRFKDGPRYGYFDQRGREPYRGGWRMPCPGSAMTSPFNPRRLHPILKTVRPHNGTDFGAPTGTPIHATSYGTIDWIGPQGPAGNLIIIKHPGDIESYYMHMHRFAPGLKKGDKVETFQVIGTVGTTGRSTGPHLHFGIRKKGKWIDPMSLQLDGDRLISASQREEFEKARAELDKQLDAIALPPPVTPEDAPAPVTPEPSDEPSEPDKKDKPEAVDPTAPREQYDDEELEPVGAVSDEPVDEEM